MMRIKASMEAAVGCLLIKIKLINDLFMHGFLYRYGDMDENFQILSDMGSINKYIISLRLILLIRIFLLTILNRMLVMNSFLILIETIPRLKNIFLSTFRSYLSTYPSHVSYHSSIRSPTSSHLASIPQTHLSYPQHNCPHKSK